LNKLTAYSRLGISEVWFWQDDQILLYHLRERVPSQFEQTHGYQLAGRSKLLPSLDIGLLAECIRQPSPLAAAKQFRNRLRNR